MESEGDVMLRLVAELKSYAPIVLTTLIIYVVESDASLRLWHAIRQLPHVEKKPSQDDSESNVDEALKKEVRKSGIEHIVLCVILLSIFVFDRFVTLSGWLNWSRGGEGFDGYAGADAESDFDGQSEFGYGWYYLTKFRQIDWAELYYPVLLFLPAVIFLARLINLISGPNKKIVLYNKQGAPLWVIRRGRFGPRRPAFMCLGIILASASLAIGALWLRNSICVILLFGSMAHYMVSYAFKTKTIMVKILIIYGLCMLVMLFMLVMLIVLCHALHPASTSTFVIKLFFKLFQAHDARDVNWPGLIIGAMVCGLAFQYIAICYRMDHAFARPDELLAGKPDIELGPRRSPNPEVYSFVDAFRTRISYFSRRRRWPKPYFHASLLSWLFSIALIALAKVQGYIECNAEMVNVYALYVAPPVISVGILVCALVRGELGNVWGYKQDWGREPKSECADGAVDASPQAKVEEVLIVIDEKTLPV